jgi:hypothetical protein
MGESELCISEEQKAKNPNPCIIINKIMVICIILNDCLTGYEQFHGVVQ